MIFNPKELQIRSAEVAEVDAEHGLVDLLMATYERESEVAPGLWEVFTRGAFDAAMPNPHRIKMTNQGHDRQNGIGKSIKLWDDGDRFLSRVKISDTSYGRDVLTLMRDEVLTEVSLEFYPKKFDSRRRAEDNLLLRHDKVTLVGVSPVLAGAHGDGSKVLSVREAAQDATRERILAELRALTSGPGAGVR